MRKAKLPAPRIQLRWAESTEPGWAWMCHYELVLPLGEHDVRREVYDKRGNLKKKERTELVAALKEPSLRSSSGMLPPCSAQNGARYYDAPYRDGAHAKWDAKLLGGLPIYCIAPDGMAFEFKETP